MDWLPTPNKLWLIGRMWDFTFGHEEPPPAAFTRHAASRELLRAAHHFVVALLLEWYLSTRT